MIAVDTNLLVYAHREDSPWHGAAERTVRGLGEGRAAWAIPWPCVHEFLAVVTHPRIYVPATPIDAAIRFIDGLLESPTLALLGVAGDQGDYWALLRAALRSGRVAGPKVHDAHVAVLCIQAGVKELWTADRDFSRFPGLAARNPLVAAPA